MISFFLLFLFCSHLTAQETPVQSPSITEEVTLLNQTIEVNSIPLSYDVRAGVARVTVKNNLSSSVSFISYSLSLPPDTPQQNRPIAFCFNGGPGSSSIWLHMGFLGPKIILVDDVNPPRIPPTYISNQETLLNSCDLVFIDPVATGFSENPSNGNEKGLYSVENDLNVFADCIRLYLTHYNRWDSPKFLVGESYGTLRAIGLTHLLQDTFFINVDGLILISLVLDMQTLDSLPSSDIPCITDLPTLAAIAQYHKKIAPTYAQLPVDILVKKVKEFSLQEYAPALLQGSSINAETEKKIETTLSALTSLSPETIRINGCRAPQSLFMDQFFKEQQKIIGRFDGRMFTYRPLEEPASGITCSGYPDPSFYQISGLFSAAFNTYLLRDLHWKKDSPYIVLNHTIQPWNWSVKSFPQAGLGYLSFLQDFRLCLAKNPHLKIFVAAGVYDLATPSFAQEYSLTHTLLPKNVQKNISFKEYASGHMIYLDKTARHLLHKDIEHFVNDTIMAKN